MHPHRAFSRQEFLKLGGVGFAGAVLLGTAGCGQQGAGSDSEDEINPDDTSPLQMTLAGASAQGFWRVIGETIGSIVREEYPGSTVEYRPGSPAGSLAQAANGQAELGGAISPVEIRAAIEGNGPFQDSLDGKFLGVMYIYYGEAKVHSVMLKDFADEHGLASFQDIAEKKPPLRISINQEGNYQMIALAEAVFEEYGFSFEDIEEWGGEVLYQPSGAGVELLADRGADMYFNGTFLPDSELSEVAQDVDMVWISLDEEKLQPVADELGVLVETVAAGSYGFITQEQKTVALPAGLVAGSEVSANDVYRMVKAIYEQREEMQSLHPDMENFSGQLMARIQEEVPLHPGAEQLFKEKQIIG